MTLTPALLRDAWQRMKMENKLKLLLNAGFKEFYLHGASVFRLHCSIDMWRCTVSGRNLLLDMTAVHMNCVRLNRMF